MHGTHVNDKKLRPHERETLFSGDIIRFGSEVTRGPGMCLVNDEPAPDCCTQRIKWLPISVKGDLRKMLDSNILPESFPPLEVIISFDWLNDTCVAFMTFLHPVLSLTRVLVPHLC